MKTNILKLMLAASISLTVTKGMAGNETIEVSRNGQTYRIEDPSKMIDASGLKSLAQTIKLATPALEANVKDVLQKEKDMEVKIAGFLTRVDLYATANENHQINLSMHESNLYLYELERAPLDAEIAAHNALAPEARSEATYQRLSAEYAKFETRRLEINAKAEELTWIGTSLENQRQQLVNEKAELEYEMAQIDIEKSFAYQQLKKCNEYAIQINKLLKDTYGEKPVIETYILDNTAELLKEMSNAMFDGNTIK